MYKIISIATVLEIDPFNPIPLKIQLDPEKYVSAQRSSEGNHGVSFLTIEGNTRFVLKREKEVAPLIVALLLSQRLGFSNPGMQIQAFESDFSQTLVEKSLETENAKKELEFFAARQIQNPTEKSLAVQVLTEKYRTRSLASMYAPTSDGRTQHMLVMDCSEGVSLKSLSSFEGNETQKNNIYQNLGKLLAFDLLIHNTDRLPLAYFGSDTNSEHQLEGNAGNLLIDSTRGILELVLIDHTVMRCGMNYDEAQLNKLRQLLIGIGNPLESSFFDAPIQFVNRYLPISSGMPNEVSKSFFVKGFLDGIRQIGNLTATEIDATFRYAAQVDSETKLDTHYIKGGIAIFKTMSTTFDRGSFSSISDRVISDIEQPSPDKLDMARQILIANKIPLDLFDDYVHTYNQSIENKKNTELAAQLNIKKIQLITQIKAALE